MAGTCGPTSVVFLLPDWQSFQPYQSQIPLLSLDLLRTSRTVGIKATDYAPYTRNMIYFVRMTYVPYPFSNISCLLRSHIFFLLCYPFSMKYIKPFFRLMSLNLKEFPMNHYPHQKDCLGLMLTAMWPTCILVFYGATQNLRLYGLRPAQMMFSGLYPSSCGPWSKRPATS